MGRHEALRPGMLARLGTWIDRRLEGTRLRRPRIGNFDPRRLRPFWAFTFVTAISLVSVTDPYSGTVLSAQASGLDKWANLPADALEFSTVQSINFERGGYKLVTGADAAIFVEQAAAPDPGTAKAFAYSLLASLGMGEDQYSCLVKLWTRESNWRVNAYNKNSGAYGIPQALPGSKMGTVAGDWLTNPETQVRWGVNYIQRRYDTPCGALAHSNEKGWY